MSLEDFADDLMLSPMPTTVGTQQAYHEAMTGDMPAPRDGSGLPGMGADTDLAAYPSDLAGPAMDWLQQNRMLVIGGAAVLGIVFFTKMGKPVRKMLGMKK